MHAELIAIGAELLLGEITDTNSAYIARALREVGVEVRWASLVGDHGGRITEVVAQALRRSPIIITTGGLGPTVDDPTRAAIAAACGVPLEFRPELWEQVVARFKRYGRFPNDNNRKQAYVPQGALALENPVGTAPCFAVEREGQVLIALPGVPREMEYMLTQVVLPHLRQTFNLAGIIRAKVLRTVGMGESVIDEKIGDLETLENPMVGLAAHAGQVDIRITATAASEAEALALIEPIEARVRRELGEFVYGEGKETVEAVTGRLLAEHGQTVAVAEVGTGGQLATRLGAIAPVDSVFRGSVAVADGATPIEGLAAQARSQHHATWGMALHIDLQATVNPIQLAVTNGDVLETRALGYGGPPALIPIWASTMALNLLRGMVLKQGS